MNLIARKSSNDHNLYIINIYIKITDGDRKNRRGYKILELDWSNIEHRGEVQKALSFVD